MKKKIITLAIVLAIVLSVALAFTLGAGAEAAEPSVSIGGKTLVLGNSIYIRYMVAAQNVNIEDVSLLVWDEAQENYVKGAEKYEVKWVKGTTTNKGVTYYHFDFQDVAAKRLTDNFYTVAYTKVGDTEYYSVPHKYSVLQFAYKTMGKLDSAASTTAGLVPMLESMLEYGANAQYYFNNYNVDRLANADYYQVKLVGGKLDDGFAEGLYLEGDTVTITADAPAEGYEFEGWRNKAGKIVSKNATATIKVGTANEVYTAVYGDGVKWDDDGALKILAIGNSFSVDTMEYAYQVAKSLGIEEVVLGNLFIGGCVIDTHYDNILNDRVKYKYYYTEDGVWNNPQNYDYIISTAIKSDNWDFISVQQGSAESGLPDTYSNLSGLVNKVKDLAGEDTEIVFNMTWAYQQNSTHNAFPNYSNNQMTMYNGIVRAMNECVVTNENISILVPNGTAIQNARTSYIGDNLTRDGYHLNKDYGRYIAAVTFISAITGISPENLEYKPAGVTDEQKVVCIESAMNALDAPLAVTASAYPGDTKPEIPEPEIPTPELPEIDEIDFSKYELTDLEITVGVFYNSDKGADTISNSSIANQFFVTQKFTREDLPVGSVIVISEGWQYRPDGWGSNGTSRPSGVNRPGNVTESVVIVDEAWWGAFETRAFNVCQTSQAPLTGYTAEDLVNVLMIYVPKISDGDGIDLSKYELTDLEITVGVFYNSDKGADTISNSSIANQFFVTQKFTREDLPVGSVIVISEGWQYRPDGWGSNGTSRPSGVNRPGNVTESVVIVDEAWWGAFETRAFNVCQTSQAPLTGYTAEDLVNVLMIYVPKTA